MWRYQDKNQCTVFMVIADIWIPLIGITPNISWSIDPFGHSPTMAYFNKKSGAKAMVIQRIHFGIKRHLAKIKTMEFQWRQIWGKLDIFSTQRLWLNRYLYTFSEEKCTIKYICEVADNFDEVLILVFSSYDLVCSYHILAACILYLIS